MKQLQNVEVLITSVEIKKSKKDNSYLVINFLTMNDGQLFTVIEKDDIELVQKLQNMNKYVLNLSLNSSKYGLQLSIDEIVKIIGSI